jgi:hypothetical protein
MTIRLVFEAVIAGVSIVALFYQGSNIILAVFGGIVISIMADMLYGAIKGFIKGWKGCDRHE